MLTTFVQIVHVFVCLFLMFVVLLQQGKGGGMGAGIGSGAAQQVFGGRGAGNILTRATAICAAVFMVTSVTLAYLSSSGDRALQRRVAAEEQHSSRSSEGAPRTAEPKAEKASDKAEGATPEAPTGNAAPEGAPKPAAPTTPAAPTDK